MKEIQYRTFSLKTHKINWGINRPNVCQFELTFGCGLHCQHCYTDCYNKPDYIKRELTTEEIKTLLDKIRNCGVLWLCFTGGDPLTRKDFLELYSYAKDKGFLITIFTNGYSMTSRIADYLAKFPPFAIEITLNAATKKTYEQISQVEGSYERAIKGINMILKRKLPLKIKTEVTKENLRELPQIKNFIKGLGLKFRPSAFLHARLDGDITPCNLRISPVEVLNLNGRKPLRDNGCEPTSNATRYTLPACRQARHAKRYTPQANLFRCAAGGGDGIYIDPYGNVVPCNCIRKPRINLLKKEIPEAQKEILSWVRAKKFSNNRKCRSCSIRNLCYSCPGKALLEKGSLDETVDWFCDLAHHIAGKQ